MRENNNGSPEIFTAEIRRKRIDCDTGDIILDEKFIESKGAIDNIKILVYSLNYLEGDLGDPNTEYYFEIIIA